MPIRCSSHWTILPELGASWQIIRECGGIKGRGRGCDCKINPGNASSQPYQNDFPPFCSALSPTFFK